MDTYSEKAAWLRTVLAGRIVTTTIVQSVTCDTISLSVEEATGIKYVRALPVAPAYPKSKSRSEARALCSCITISVLFFAHRSIPAYSSTDHRIRAKRSLILRPDKWLGATSPRQCPQRLLFTAAADWLLCRSVATGVIATTAAETIGTRVPRRVGQTR